MLETLSFIPLILLIFITLFITVFLHELGHALPALKMTERYESIYIYMGSFGDSSRCFQFQLGRLIVYCKYNPLLWYKGCCISPDYNFSIDQKLIFTAGGPLASIICAVATWFLLSAVQQEGFLRILAGSIFTVSLLHSLAILIPDPRPRYTPTGYPVYCDTIQLFRLLKMKFS